ncbi:33357_t:CDS:2 [Gigaspora margarita]|uniref:33357_t:CDS:1 n=1 Tax=Gigaspora margarita TaxID=4874 RepID=A0ABN7VM76_GIGMA|nr:33357_t:CDS:2 [Gigaspora margarita]
MNYAISYITSHITSLALTDWLTIFLIIALLYTTEYYLSYFTRSNPLPGPLPFPIIGNAYLFRGDYSEVFLKLQKKYGTMMEVYFGPKRMIWIGDAKLIKKLNDPSPKSNFPYRAIGSWIDELKMTGMGMGLNNHMSSWRFNRAMLAKSVIVPSLFRQLVHVMEKTFEELEAIEMLGRIRIWQKSIVFFYFFPKFLRHYIPPFTFLNTKYLYNINWLNEYFINITKIRRKEIENTPKGETLSSDILTSLICSNTHLGTQFDNINDEYGRPMTNEEIMRVTIEAITGAQSKVHDEIDRVLGKDINRPITYDDLIKLHYIEACFKESLRMVPVIPFIFKASDKEDTVAENSHLPFGGGIRICPGRHLALTNAKMFITLIFRKYKMELVDDNSFAKFYDLDNGCIKLEVYLRPRCEE